jgi:RNA polymerase sigma factor (sigma-70 family)
MDREAFYSQFIKPHEPAMMRTIWRLTRDSDDAEDVFQETLCELWKRRNKVERHPNVKALLLKISTCHACNCLRSRSARKKRLQPLNRDVLADRRSGPLETLQRKETAELILGGLRRLSKRQGESICLRIVEGLDYEDIAKAMGCSESTVRVHVKRGREALRSFLLNAGNPEGGLVNVN